jgi:hypothetical protein
MIEKTHQHFHDTGRKRAPKRELVQALCVQKDVFGGVWEPMCPQNVPGPVPGLDFP